MIIAKNLEEAEAMTEAMMIITAEVTGAEAMQEVTEEEAVTTRAEDIPEMKE